MKKPKGTYITIEASDMMEEDEDYHREVSGQLAKVIETMLPGKKEELKILVVGLGNREVTPELLQDAVTPEHIVEIAGAWITDETKRQQNIQELKEVRSKLGDSGAVRRTGELILNTARIGKE